MSDTPEPPRRLEWPHQPRGLDDDEPDDVVDPGGNWLPESGSAPQTTEPLTFETIFRDDRRWAPQHAREGRSESAMPGAFLFPEPAPPRAFRPDPEESGEGEAVLAGEASPGKHRTALLLREIVETVLLAVLVFLAVRASVQHYRVEGTSMDPTLKDGEFLLVNSLVYSEINIEKVGNVVPFWDPNPPAQRQVFHGPDRGDIIILHPSQRDDRDLVKRVIGLPGDTMEIRDGTVYIDGRELIEHYVKEPWHGSMPPITLAADYYFVMGDNRNNSADSRSFGPVNEDDIIGKAMASWWPRETWGLAPNEEPQFAEETR